MNEITTTVPAQRQDIIAPFDYSVLPPDQAQLARDAATFIDSQHRKIAATAIAIGERLNTVKTALGHGHFTAWVNASFTMTLRTAQNYMAVATALADKSESVSHLPVTTVYELARAPEPIRTKVIDELSTAAAPATPKAVSTLIWKAQQEAKEETRLAKLTPAQKKRDKDAREKSRADLAARNVLMRRKEAALERSAVQLAELLLSKLGDDVEVVAALLRETGIPGSQLARRLTGNLYGASWRSGREEPVTKDEWLAMLAHLDQGENPVR